MTWMAIGFWIFVGAGLATAGWLKFMSFIAKKTGAKAGE